MTSWYARNSLMPSTGRRKASNQITDIYDRDRYRQDKLKKCIGRELQRCYSFEQDVHTTGCKGLLDNQIEINDIVTSQISDISMSQSNGNSQRGTNNEERSGSKVGALLVSHAKETAPLPMRSSSQTPDNIGASLSYSVTSVPTRSSGGSISAFSNGLFRSSALSWQPAKFRNQLLPFSQDCLKEKVMHMPIPTITDKSTRTQSQFKTREWNLSADRSHTVIENRSPQSSISDMQYASRQEQNQNARTSYVNIKGEQMSFNSAYVDSTPASESTSVSHGSSSDDKSNEFVRTRLSNDQFSNSSISRFKLARSIFRTDDEFHSNGKDGSIKKKAHPTYTSPGTSHVRDRAVEILQRIEVKERCLTQQLVAMENQEHNMQLRLAAAEEAQAQKADALKEQHQLILNEIGRFKREIHSAKQRSESQLNCVSTEIIKKLKESSEIMNNSITEKMTDLDKSISRAHENYQLNLYELRVKKEEIDSTYAKATRKVQEADNIMTKFGRLADSTFEAIRNARSAMFDSVLPCLQDPITEMVKRILGETGKSNKGVDSPFPVTNATTSEVEWQDIARDEIPATATCSPKTPSTKTKRGREEYIRLQRRPLKRACKSRIGNKTTDSKKKKAFRRIRSPEPASSTTDSKCKYSLLETPKRNFCVTPCEKENAFHLLLAETPVENLEMSKKGAKHRTSMIRKKFGNTRLNVIDDEFSFL